MKKLIIPLLLMQWLAAMEQEPFEITKLPHEMQTEILKRADGISLARLKLACKKSNQDVNELICNPEASQLLKWVCGKVTSKTFVVRRQSYCGAISLDCRYMVTVSENDEIQFWDLKTGECLSKLEGVHTNCSSLAISADNNYIITGSTSGTIKIWDVKSGSCIHTLEGHQNVIESIAISADNNYFVTGSFDNTAKIWDGKSGKLLHTLEGHIDQITSVAISQNNLIVTSSNDSTVKVWNGLSGKLIHSLEGHKNEISAIAISIDSSLIVTSSVFEPIRVWDAKSGKCIYTFNIDRLVFFIKKLAISSDNSFIIISDGHNSEIWGITPGECLRSFDGGGLIAITPDNRCILISSLDTSVILSIDDITS